MRGTIRQWGMNLAATRCRVHTMPGVATHRFTALAARERATTDLLREARGKWWNWPALPSWARGMNSVSFTQ